MATNKQYFARLQKAVEQGKLNLFSKKSSTGATSRIRLGKNIFIGYGKKAYGYRADTLEHAKKIDSDLTKVDLSKKGSIGKTLDKLQLSKYLSKGGKPYSNETKTDFIKRVKDSHITFIGQGGIMSKRGKKNLLSNEDKPKLTREQLVQSMLKQGGLSFGKGKKDFIAMSKREIKGFDKEVLSTAAGKQAFGLGKASKKDLIKDYLQDRKEEKRAKGIKAGAAIAKETVDTLWGAWSRTYRGRE